MYSFERQSVAKLGDHFEDVTISELYTTPYTVLVENFKSSRMEFTRIRNRKRVWLEILDLEPQTPELRNENGRTFVRNLIDLATRSLHFQFVSRRGAPTLPIVPRAIVGGDENSICSAGVERMWRG